MKIEKQKQKIIAAINVFSVIKKATKIAEKYIKVTNVFFEAHVFDNCDEIISLIIHYEKNGEKTNFTANNYNFEQEFSINYLLSKVEIEAKKASDAN